MEANPATRDTSVATDDRRIAEARRQEIRALAAMDGLDLADEAIMAKAWHAAPSVRTAPPRTTPPPS